MAYPVLFVTTLAEYPTEGTNVGVTQCVHSFESRVHAEQAIQALTTWTETGKYGSVAHSIAISAVKLYQE